ncbi:MAG: right-handed parallel beta-helix repeat-containing protein, partial [Planctomycetaceae bacterium]|nr:right-handed parallel beta-helix repeat-containing protein [Planctomycetaceae bacterium]
MLITPWLKLFMNRLRWVARLSGRGRRSRFRPRSTQPFSFERLEDRTLLSTLTVTSLDDNTIDGDSFVTLREAIIAANTDGTTDNGESGSGADEIVFAAGLNGVILLDGATLGELVITDDLTISGLGSAHTIIDAQQNSRIFDITNTAGNVTFDSLTLTNGNLTQDEGGAIRSRVTGLLTIANSTLSNNRTNYSGQDGGAIDANGDVLIQNSIFQNNIADGTASGGAIHVSSGSLTVEHSTFTGNRTTDHNAYGGAISVNGNVTISDSTLSGNSTNSRSSDGGAIHSSGDVTIIRSTLSGNSTNGNDADGGAIFAGNNLTIVNSTLSRNSTSGDAAHGGAIYGNYVTIVNSTITGNRANGANAIGGGIHQFGGLPTSTHIRNSIVADNYAYTNPDLYSDSNNFAIDNSLIGDASGTTLTETGTAAPDADGNFIGDSTSFGVIDPLLGPLQNNGGFVETHELRANSLAIDAGDNALAVDPSNGNVALTTDQRGGFFARIFNTTVDMGAFELQTFDPALLVVDNATDEYDGDLSDGDRSLREVVALANGNPGADTITFAAALDGTPLLLDGATFGDIDITDDVTITGNGAANTVIDAQQFSRIFEITNSVDDTTLESLTLQNARTFGNGFGSGGGAIFTLQNGTLTISDSSLTGNSTAGESADGGAVDMAGTSSLTVINSTFTNNWTEGDEAKGGAIYNTDALLDIRGSTFTGNSTAGDDAIGGAIAGNSVVRITDSTFSGNSTAGDDAHGGAIGVSSIALSITNSTLSGNTSSGFGGGLYSDDDLTVIGSTIAGNNADRGGGIAVTGGTVVISNSTISGNTADDIGGGIYLDGDDVAITNSTISGNDAIEGGGIYQESTSDITIVNSTVTGNTATVEGGGVYTHGDLFIHNSIIAGNTDPGVAPDLYSENDNYTVSHSLIGDATGTSLVETGTAAPDANGNYIGDSTGGGIINPMLGVLQDNGGPTFTHALLDGSLAINSGDDALAVDDDDVPLEFDQRGDDFARIVGTVDMGAFEVQALDPALFVVDNATDEFDSDFSDGDRSLREVIHRARKLTAKVRANSTRPVAMRTWTLPGVPSLNEDAMLEATVAGLVEEIRLSVTTGDADSTMATAMVSPSARPR